MCVCLCLDALTVCAAQLERMSELHSQREKSLMKTITQLKEKVQTLENQKQEDSSRRSIQKLSKDVRVVEF